MRTAVFYSISNCQRGLAGVSFGNFLIKQVVEDINREMPKLATFVTLSPVTSFADWLKRERANEASIALNAADKELFALLDDANLVARRREGGAAAGAADARRRVLFPARAQHRAACRSMRWRASISATARGSSASTGLPTPRTRRWRRRTA